VLRGYNYRMDAVQGAILNVKMKYIESWTEARRAIAAMYNRLLAQDRYQSPEPDTNGRHFFQVYAIAVKPPR
jgi:dTDP-4-amino-4,6-dideoxygalactose transaminase